MGPESLPCSIHSARAVIPLQPEHEVSHNHPLAVRFLSFLYYQPELKVSTRHGDKCAHGAKLLAFLKHR